MKLLAIIAVHPHSETDDLLQLPWQLATIAATVN